MGFGGTHNKNIALLEWIRRTLNPVDAAAADEIIQFIRIVRVHFEIRRNRLVVAAVAH